MYSGLKQAKQVSQSKAGKNTVLRVAFLQQGNAAAGEWQPELLQKQTILSSTSGYYYIDGIAVSATETEESMIYGDLYECTDSYY